MINRAESEGPNMNVFSDEPYSETDLARDAEADIALPDSSLGSLPEGDTELPIANLFVGLGDRSRAEKTLSNPIGKYFIISQIGGSAFVDNSSD